MCSSLLHGCSRLGAAGGTTTRAAVGLPPFGHLDREWAGQGRRVLRRMRRLACHCMGVGVGRNHRWVCMCVREVGVALQSKSALRCMGESTGGVDVACVCEGRGCCAEHVGCRCMTVLIFWGGEKTAGMGLPLHGYRVGEADKMERRGRHEQMAHSFARVGVPRAWWRCCHAGSCQAHAVVGQPAVFQGARRLGCRGAFERMQHLVCQSLLEDVCAGEVPGDLTKRSKCRHQSGNLMCMLGGREGVRQLSWQRLIRACAGRAADANACVAEGCVAPRHAACVAEGCVAPRHAACVAEGCVAPRHAACVAEGCVAPRHAACVAEGCMAPRHAARVAEGCMAPRHAACVALTWDSHAVRLPLTMLLRKENSIPPPAPPKAVEATSMSNTRLLKS
eukprot:351258-Chlamydomonas_euryale.AAC.1